MPVLLCCKAESLDGHAANLAGLHAGDIVTVESLIRQIAKPDRRRKRLTLPFLRVATAGRRSRDRMLPTSVAQPPPWIILPLFAVVMPSSNHARATEILKLIILAAREPLFFGKIHPMRYRGGPGQAESSPHRKRDHRRDTAQRRQVRQAPKWSAATLCYDMQ